MRFRQFKITEAPGDAAFKQSLQTFYSTLTKKNPGDGLFANNARKNENMRLVAQFAQENDLQSMLNPLTGKSYKFADATGDEGPGETEPEEVSMDMAALERLGAVGELPRGIVEKLKSEAEAAKSGKAGLGGRTVSSLFGIENPEMADKIQNIVSKNAAAQPTPADPGQDDDARPGEGPTPADPGQDDDARPGEGPTPADPGQDDTPGAEPTPTPVQSGGKGGEFDTTQPTPADPGQDDTPDDNLLSTPPAGADGPDPSELKPAPAPATPTSFGAAFKAARKTHGGPGGMFTYKGKKYQTNVKGEPYAKNPVPVKAAAAPKPTPVAPTPVDPQAGVVYDDDPVDPYDGMGGLDDPDDNLPAPAPAPAPAMPSGALGTGDIDVTQGHKEPAPPAAPPATTSAPEVVKPTATNVPKPGQKAPAIAPEKKNVRKPAPKVVKAPPKKTPLAMTNVMSGYDGTTRLKYLAGIKGKK